MGIAHLCLHCAIVQKSESLSEPVLSLSSKDCPLDGSEGDPSLLEREASSLDALSVDPSILDSAADLEALLSSPLPLSSLDCNGLDGVVSLPSAQLADKKKQVHEQK